MAGKCGWNTALASLTTNSGGRTLVNGGAITTAGNQTYGDTVTLGANTVLRGITPTFAATAVAGGGFDLALNFSGATTVNGTFTGIKNLASGNGGGTTLSGTVSTTGTQSYDDAITLGGATTLTSAGLGSAGDIIFNSTVNGAQMLTVNTGGRSSSADRLERRPVFRASRPTLGAPVFGTVTSGATTVTTSGAQTYNDDLSMAAITTLVRHRKNGDGREQLR